MSGQGRAAKQNEFTKQPERSKTRRGIPQQIGYMKTVGLITINAKIQPIGKITQRQKFPRVLRLQKKLVQIARRRLAQEAIHIRQINLIIGEGVVQQGWQIQTEA